MQKTSNERTVMYFTFNSIMPKQGVHFLKLHDRIQPSLVYGTIFFIQLNPKKI